MKRFYIFLFLLILSVGCSKIPSVEQQEVLVMIVYPNPADSRINIHVRNDEMAAYLIQVFDPKADLIFEENVEAGNPKNSWSIDLTDRPKGSYQAILKKNGIVHSKKFLKI